MFSVWPWGQNESSWVAVSNRQVSAQPKENILKIRALRWNGYQRVVGSLTGAVLNQRTDDHILEMFSIGLMSQAGFELDAPEFFSAQTLNL